jgi:hypothetical protein
LHELGGLDDDAERARDAVMNFLDQLSGGTSSPQPPATPA